MKIPAQLSKGLSKEEVEQLENNLKHSVLARKLREYLQSAIEHMEITEESIDAELYQIYSIVGQRRGFRQILNLLPEK